MLPTITSARLLAKLPHCTETEEAEGTEEEKWNNNNNGDDDDDDDGDDGDDDDDDNDDNVDDDDDRIFTFCRNCWYSLFSVSHHFAAFR